MCPYSLSWYSFPLKVLWIGLTGPLLVLMARLAGPPDTYCCSQECWASWQRRRWWTHIFESMREDLETSLLKESERRDPGNPCRQWPANVMVLSTSNTAMKLDYKRGGHLRYGNSHGLADPVSQTCTHRQVLLQVINDFVTRFTSATYS